MDLNIGEKNFSTKFGYGFLKKVNEKYSVVGNTGVKVPMGIGSVVTNLLLGDIETAFDVIIMANQTESPKITITDLEAKLDEVGAKVLINDLLEELKKSEYCKIMVLKQIEDTPEVANLIQD